MNKLYSRINWENEPSTKTPLNENNLNKIDFAVDQMDDRIISLDASKFKKSEAEHLVKNIELDKATGVFTITFYSGATAKIDTLLEKLAVNFEYDPVEQRLIITLDNQEKQYIDLSALITEYEFSESDTVAFEVSEGGEVKAKVKNGSITGEHLRPDYLADVTVEVEKAKASQAEATASAERSAASASEAKLSASAAKDSQDAAKLSEKASKESENLSVSSAAAARESENNAEKSATMAATSEAKAKNSEEQAKSAQTAAAESTEAAELSKQNAAQSEANAEKWRKLSESYAHGGTDTREGEETDNSEYWYEQAKRLVQGMNGIVNMGSKTFEQLATAEKVVNYMYNVTDAFTSDETFNTPGVYYGAGNNVVWTGEGKWDVMAASAVNGIKGNNETYFHQGNYTVSPENLKLDTFAVAAQRAMVSADDPLDVAFGKLAKYCADLKNVAFSGKYADMSGIGDLTAQTAVADTDNMLVGTDVAKKITFANVFNAIKSKLTGAVSTILTSILKGNMALVSDTSGKVAAHGTVTATELGYLHGATSNIQNQIGTLSALGTTAKGNLVSAINELNTGLSVSIISSVVNLDDLRSGLYIFNGYEQNITGDKPFINSWGLLLCIKVTISAKMQMAINVDTANIYIRHGMNISGYNNWISN